MPNIRHRRYIIPYNDVIDCEATNEQKGGSDRHKAVTKGG
jgi:hypothetical protein